MGAAEVAQFLSMLVNERRVCLRQRHLQGALRPQKSANPSPHALFQRAVHGKAITHNLLIIKKNPRTSRPVIFWQV